MIQVSNLKAFSFTAELRFTRETPEYKEGASDKDEFHERANAVEETLCSTLAVAPRG